MPESYYPVLLGVAAALAIGSALLAVSYLLSPKTGGWVKLSTYESGMPLLDRSHKRLSIAFFLVAIDFVVFDVEAAFLYPWALVARQGGWELLAAVGSFFLLLVAGLLFVWLKGGLDVRVRRTPLPDEASR